MNTGNNKQWHTGLLEGLSNVVIIFGKDLSWSASRTVWTHSHDFYQLDYFYNGSGNVTISGNNYTVKSCDLFITNPGEEHSFEAASKQPMEGFTLKFDLKDAGPKPIFPNYIGNLARLSLNQRYELERLLHRACIEMNKAGSENPHLAAGFLTVFFGLLLRYLQDVQHLLSSGSTLSKNERVVEYITRHYDRRITLKDLAHIAQLEPDYFCHKFSAEMGMSPIAALTNQRIEAAKQLLINTRLPIAEVGVRVGYPDAYHFSRRFKEVVGKSPKQYRVEFQQVPTDLSPPPERAQADHVAAGARLKDLNSLFTARPGAN